MTIPDCDAPRKEVVSKVEGSYSEITARLIAQGKAEGRPECDIPIIHGPSATKPVNLPFHPVVSPIVASQLAVTPMVVPPIPMGGTQPGGTPPAPTLEPSPEPSPEPTREDYQPGGALPAELRDEVYLSRAASVLEQTGFRALANVIRVELMNDLVPIPDLPPPAAAPIPDLPPPAAAPIPDLPPPAAAPAAPIPEQAAPTEATKPAEPTSTKGEPQG